VRSRGIQRLAAGSSSCPAIRLTLRRLRLIRQLPRIIGSGQYFVQRDCDKERLTKQLLRRLRELGVGVKTKETAA